MTIIKVVWKDRYGRRCTSFIEAPQVTGEVIEVTHKTSEELNALANKYFPKKKVDK